MVLRAGRIEQIGTPREIYDAPATDYVAHLVGDPIMNLIDGVIQEESGRLVFRGDGIHVSPPAQAEGRIRQLLEGGGNEIRLESVPPMSPSMSVTNPVQTSCCRSMRWSTRRTT